MSHPVSWLPYIVIGILLYLWVVVLIGPYLGRLLARLREARSVEHSEVSGAEEGSRMFTEQ